MDSATLAILANRFDTVTRAMANTLLRTARSGVLNTARDLSTAILTPEGGLVVCGESLPVHVGGLSLEARALLELHGANLLPGDAFLNNSPYHGGTHHADHTVIVPVFFGGRHVMTVCAKAHQADTGNALPTTYSPEAADVYAEGALSLPCVRVQSDYRDIADIIRICRARIRVPEQWYGDYLAAIGAARIGEQTVQGLFQEYGPETIEEFTSAWNDYGRRRAGAAIERLPDRAVTATSHHDPFPGIPDGVAVTVEVRSDPKAAEVRVDLTRNVDCLPCGLNLSPASALAAVNTGVLTSLGSDIPLNAGALSRVIVETRPGSAIGGPVEPASCSASTTNLFDRLVNAIWSAMAQLGAEVRIAGGGLGMPASYSVVSGRDPRHHSAAFVNQLFLGATGGPATSDGDGWLTFSMTGDVGVAYRDSVEIDEQKYPLLIHRQALLEDSEGAGRHIGASSLETEFGPTLAPLTAVYLSDGHVFPADGADGGGTGHPAGVWLVEADGAAHELPQVGHVELKPGQRLRSVCAGGGGYGDPRDRDPDAVARDVHDGLISRARARAVYGADLRRTGMQGKTRSSISEAGPECP